MGERIIILGAGGHGKVVAEAAYMTKKWEEIAFLDDNDGLKEVTGFPVIGKFSDYKSLVGKYQYAFVAIGDNKARIKWLELLKEAGYNIPVIAHPFSFVSKSSFIEEGTVVMPGAVINASVTVGKGCIINTCSSIDHDCVLGNGTHVSPGVHIGGNVRIGSYTWLCIGSSIANGITIGSNVVVAAGAAVINNIPDNVMVAGVPAVIKKHLGDSNNE